MKDKNKYILVLLIVFGVLVAGCSGPKQTSPETPMQKAPIDTQPAEKATPEIKVMEKGTENDKMTDQDAQKII